MSRSKRSQIISLAIILLSVGLVLLIAFSNSGLADAWGAIRSMDPKWFLTGVLCYAFYVFMAGTALYLFLRHNGYRVRLGTAVHFTFSGLFYANITPGSSGGQPMQIYQMNRRGIPVGTATSALMIQIFFNQLSVTMLTLILWLCNFDFCREYLSGAAFFIIVGWIINFLVIPIVLLAIFHRDWIDRLGSVIIGWISRRRWGKGIDAETWQQKLAVMLDQYEAAIRLELAHPVQLIFQFLCSLGAMLGLLAVPAIVYRAMGMHGSSVWQLLTASSMLFSSASYTPLPGASGAQEGGFLYFFRSFFTGGTVSVALLVWRFITYYLCLLLGAADALWTNLRRRRDPVLREEMAAEAARAAAEELARTEAESHSERSDPS